jgi:hypothetical protein
MPQREEIKRDDVLLFSESNSRFLVEVAPANQQSSRMICAATLSL